MNRPNESKRYLDPARETAPWETRRENLERTFLNLFRHAALNSPAYRMLLQDHGVDPGGIQGLGDLGRLPIIHMDFLVERQKEAPPFGGFETVPPDRIRRVYVNPGLIWQPAEWDYADTSWAEGLAGAGFGPGDLALNAFNYHLWPYAFQLDESARMVGAAVVPTGVGNTLMQVNILKMLKVNAFMGTPSFLNTLLQRAEGMGLDVRKDLFLTKAMVGAEMLPESLRARMEAKGGLTIRQTYGTVLTGCIGYECEYKTGLHVPDGVIVEVVDPHTGQPMAEGASGEIVATGQSRVYPLIRFATGDLSLFSKEPCPCGRTGPMLAKVLGRVDQAAKVRGTFVHPWQTDGVMARFPEVFKYQVRITREKDLDIMTFLVELKDEPANPALLAGRMERDIKEFLTIRGDVQIVPRGSIPDFHQKILDRRSWE